MNGLPGWILGAWQPGSDPRLHFQSDSCFLFSSRSSGAVKPRPGPARPGPGGGGNRAVERRGRRPGVNPGRSWEAISRRGAQRRSIWIKAAPGGGLKGGAATLQWSREPSESAAPLGHLLWRRNKVAADSSRIRESRPLIGRRRAENSASGSDDRLIFILFSSASTCFNLLLMRRL